MRNPNRISIVLDFFLDEKILKKFLETSSQKLVDNIYDNWEEVESKWKDYPDLRFGQLLCTLNLIPSKTIEDEIWDVEEDYWLIDNKYCKFEEIKFWSSIFDKHNKKRKKVKYILLKDLTNSHIEGIIKWFRNNSDEARIRKDYLRYFKKRINSI